MSGKLFERGRKSWVTNILIILVSLLTALIMVEMILRYSFKELQVIANDERSTIYRYDSALGWFPKEGFEGYFKGMSRMVSVKNNSRGFRDVEHIISNKPVMLFIGDSFVWGYDVEAEERFTERLRKRIPGWDIYNLGVSGYGTDQEYLLLKDQIGYYKPKVVFLIMCIGNDLHDNASNFRYGYFKPYFAIEGKGLRLKGVPPAKNLTYFVKNHPLLSKLMIARFVAVALYPRIVFNDEPIAAEIVNLGPRNPTLHILLEINMLVEKNGGKLIVGFEQPHREIEDFLRRNRILYLQLFTSDRFLATGLHWTPKGHEDVAEMIYEFLIKEKIIYEVIESSISK